MEGKDGAKDKVSRETKSLLMKIGEAASKLDENKVEKKEEATLGDLMGVMGGLMAAFAPPEQGKEIQKQFQEMGQTMGPMFEGLAKGAGAFDTPAYHWVEMKSNDKLPENAFAAGKDGSETPNVFVARAEIDGKFCVGKVHNNTRYCWKPEVSEKVVTSEPFSVLCVDPKADLEWVMYDPKYEELQFGELGFPKGIVSAGKDRFVGRGFVFNERDKLNPGLVHTGHITEIYWLHCLYGGQSHKLNKFEVLCIKNEKQGTDMKDVLGEIEGIEASIEEHQKELEKLKIKRKELKEGLDKK